MHSPWVVYRHESTHIPRAITTASDSKEENLFYSARYVNTAKDLVVCDMSFSIDASRAADRRLILKRQMLKKAIAYSY
ncbi:MAG: hypothetical protein GF401_03440 [Chitinivibrionales bacterium]|nr:hypothetical protein [Chitinivibrionales bacterium]